MLHAPFFDRFAICISHGRRKNRRLPESSAYYRSNTLISVYHILSKKSSGGRQSRQPIPSGGFLRSTPKLCPTRRKRLLRGQSFQIIAVSAFPERGGEPQSGGGLNKSHSNSGRALPSAIPPAHCGEREGAFSHGGKPAPVSCRARPRSRSAYAPLYTANE